MALLAAIIDGSCHGNASAAAQCSRGEVCQPKSGGKLHPVDEDNCRISRVIIALGSSVLFMLNLF